MVSMCLLREKLRSVVKLQMAQENFFGPVLVILLPLNVWLEVLCTEVKTHWLQE